MMIAAGGGGCVAPTADESWHGDPPIRAVYFGGGLTADLPAEVRVPAVTAAADAALGSAGYVITARDATIDRGRVVARTSDARLSGRRIRVNAEPLAGATRVRIRVEPGGEPAISREILERMLSRMGL